MENKPHPPIPQVQDKKEICTTRNIKRSDCARQLQYITGNLINQILHSVDNNILKNLLITEEDVRMAEDIYGPSTPHLKCKTVRQNIQHVEPVKITSVSQTILDKYKQVTICCYLIQINGIGFLNTISRHIMLAKGNMIKNRQIENIVDGITQVNKLYLQCGFKITHMHTDFQVEPPCK